MLKINESKLIKSMVSIKDAPDLKLPEFVMLGRSNVGKSSFINALCNRKKLAYISKIPGKTRLINLYQINEDFILTDLPGYGYSQRSATEQKQWKKFIEEYIIGRKEIISAIHLIDSRHDIQKNDLQMHEWLQYNNINSIVVLTKADHLSHNELQNRIVHIKQEINQFGIPFSAKTKQGKDQVLKTITSFLKN